MQGTVQWAILRDPPPPFGRDPPRGWRGPNRGRGKHEFVPEEAIVSRLTGGLIIIRKRRMDAEYISIYLSTYLSTYPSAVSGVNLLASKP